MYPPPLGLNKERKKNVSPQGKKGEEFTLKKGGGSNYFTELQNTQDWGKGKTFVEGKKKKKDHRPEKGERNSPEELPLPTFPKSKPEYGSPQKEKVKKVPSTFKKGVPKTIIPKPKKKKKQTFPKKKRGERGESSTGRKKNYFPPLVLSTTQRRMGSKCVGEEKGQDKFKGGFQKNGFFHLLFPSQKKRGVGPRRKGSVPYPERGERRTFQWKANLKKIQV